MEATAWSIVIGTLLLIGAFGYAAFPRTQTNLARRLIRLLIMIIGATVGALALNGIANQLFMSIEFNAVDDFGGIAEDETRPDMPLHTHRTMSNTIANTPKPPYYAVIFTSLRTEGDRGYGNMADRMVELAGKQPGFLGVESARTPDGLGITVSYWSSEQAIAAWKAHADHRIAQETGQRVWYSDYHLRMAKVERDYGKNAA